MSTFTIDQDNNITAYAHAGEIAHNGASAETPFDSQEALAQIAAEWPLSRWVEIWNSIPGQTPIKKFQDRKRAIARVWAAIQSLAEQQPKEDAVVGPGRKPKVTKGTPKAAKKGPGKAAKASERGNKKAEVIALIKRFQGSNAD